ncbi:MAG: hypothetical protein LBU94_05270, partial [Clostridiales bacterium]|nr:hypothetical protein [Clostridiales bacterium]
VSNLKIFSQDIELFDGENIIIIKALKNNVYQAYDFNVNKKSKEIKAELEKGARVIPFGVTQGE